MPCFLFLLFRLPAVWPGCPVSHTAEDVPAESTEGGTNQLMKMPWAFQSISLAWRGAGPRVLSLPTTTQVAINSTTGTLLTTPDAGVNPSSINPAQIPTESAPNCAHPGVTETKTLTSNKLFPLHGYFRENNITRTVWARKGLD